MLNDIIGSQGDLLSNSTSKVDKSKDNDASIIKITQSHARSIIQENINEANTDSNMEKDTIEEDFCNLNNYDKPLETNLETYRMEVISTLDSFREIQINLKEKRMLLKTIYTSHVTIAQLMDENKLEMMTTRRKKEEIWPTGAAGEIQPPGAAIGIQPMGASEDCDGIIIVTK